MEETDIVARLRKTHPMGATPESGVVLVRFHFYSTTDQWINDVHLTIKAADEIERLRAELRKYTGDDHNTEGTCTQNTQS